MLFPGEDHLSFPSFPQLPIALCVGLRSCGLFSLADSFVSSLFISPLDSCIGETLLAQLLVLLGNTVSLKTPWSSCSSIFPPFFCNFPWSLGTGVFCSCIQWECCHLVWTDKCWIFPFKKFTLIHYTYDRLVWPDEHDVTFTTNIFVKQMRRNKSVKSYSVKLIRD